MNGVEPLPIPDRQRLILELVSDVYGKAVRGELDSFAYVAEHINGSTMLFGFTPTNNALAVGGALISAGARRMGLVHTHDHE